MKTFNEIFGLHVSFSPPRMALMKFMMIAIAMLFISTTATAQIKKRVSPRVYERVAYSRTMVEAKTIKDGEVSEAENTSLEEIRMDRNSKKVAAYGKEISLIDEATYAKIKLFPEATGLRENYSVLPELHIERASADPESYRIIFSHNKPFRFDHGLETFNTTIGFFLLSESGNSASNTLEPVNLEVVSDGVRTIKPVHFEMQRLGLPSSNVELSTTNVIDSVEVKVITTASPDGFKTYLKVEPALQIVTNKSTLQGFGVQKIPIEVRLIGSSSSESMNVSFVIEKGTVEPASMVVSYNSPSTVYIRSEGIGEAKLFAFTSRLESNTVSLTYIFPWFFLLFSIAGGLIGGFARHFTRPGNKKVVWRPIIGGVLIGFIVAVAYYFLGINLIGIELNTIQNEIAVLGLSALGAYFGISIGSKPTA